MDLRELHICQQSSEGHVNIIYIFSERHLHSYLGFDMNGMGIV